MAPISNRYTALAGIEHPIVQEGLGPFTTAKLAAAVSSAGGEGDVENSLVMTGQVASAIHDLVHIAEFVPAVAQEAADILRRLGAAVS
jgi:enoyl-[acyl-carrier protein] reductase II